MMKTQTAASVLDALFAPRGIAVVGGVSRPESMGSRTLRALVDFGYGGTLAAVSREGAAAGDVAGYRRVTEIAGPLDLCIIAVPAKDVASVLADCAARGVTVAQVLSSAYGDSHETREAWLDAACGVTRIVGPNCLGTHCTSSRVTFVREPRPDVGSVSIVSQSGGLTIDMIHQAGVRGLALSKAVSIGDSIDVNPADFLAYLAEDPQTTAIGFYLEGIGDGRFLDVLRSTTPRKPVVILKGGRTAQGAASVVSHTGALAGDYAVWRAVMAQVGALEARSPDELLAVLTGLQCDVPLPGGNHVALIGNGGGMTVLATDVLGEGGMAATAVGEASRHRIATIGLPAGSSVGSALDLPLGALSQMEPEALEEILAAVIDDANIHLVLAHFNLIPFLNYPDPMRLARMLGAVLTAREHREKPLYVALRASLDARIEHLRQAVMDVCDAAGLPCFADALEAAGAADAAWRRTQFLARRAFPAGDGQALARETVQRCRAILDRARREERSLLTQVEAFGILAALGIAHPPYALACDATQAGDVAATLGFPVALKIESPDVVHKSDGGGVRLGIGSSVEAAAAFTSIVDATRKRDPAARVTGAIVQRMAPPPVAEMIAGVKRDAQFGPIVLAGTGGIFVELFRDVALRAAPLGGDDAREMLRELRSAPLLDGYRGAPPADLAGLENILLTVSRFACAFPEVAELDLNPIFASESDVVAVDCRILLH